MSSWTPCQTLCLTRPLLGALTDSYGAAIAKWDDVPTSELDERGVISDAAERRRLFALGRSAGSIAHALEAGRHRLWQPQAAASS